MNGDSSVNHNAATGNGGGIYNLGSVTLSDSSSVTRNTASGEGGGIYSDKSEGATLAFGIGWSGTVSRNEPDDMFFA